MARGRRRQTESSSLWPGFVDAMSGLLMLIIFLVLVLAVAQFFLSNDFDAVSDQADALLRENQDLNAENASLDARVSELSSQLALLSDQLLDREAAEARLQADLASAESETTSLLRQLTDTQENLSELNARLLGAENEQASLSAYIATLEAENSALRDDSDALNFVSMSYLAQLDQTQRTTETQAANLAALQQRFSYLFPETPDVQTPSTGDPSQDLVLQVEATAALLDRMLSRAEQLQSELEQLIAARSFLTEQLENADQANAELARQLAAEQGERNGLEALLAQRERELARVDAELVDAYTSLDADARRLETLVGEVEALRQIRDRYLAQVENLQAALLARDGDAESLETQLANSQAEREVQSAAARDAQAQVEFLNVQVIELRQQLARLERALQASEARAREQDIEIVQLGSRLNAALADRVEELATYRSEFFGRLREVLGERSDVAIVGDRFIFQSEVLFPSGSATMSAEGRAQLNGLADTILDLATDIPDDIDWVLRVDGHTDERPIVSNTFENNWQLSTERARTVGEYLISRGVDPQRIAITGFGEFQPLVEGTSEAAYARNRRIEFKLTQR